LVCLFFLLLFLVLGLRPSLPRFLLLFLLLLLLLLLFLPPSQKAPRGPKKTTGGRGGEREGGRETK